MRVVQETPEDDVIENDLILVWSTRKRIITGSDLLGRLLRGIAIVEPIKQPVPEGQRA
jgi:metal transporter CNNM